MQHFDEWIYKRAIIRLNATRFNRNNFFSYPKDKKNCNVRAMCRMVQQYEKEGSFSA